MTASLDQPAPEFIVQIIEIRKILAVEENSRIPHQAFDSAFFIAAVGIAGMDLESIVPGELQKLRTVFDPLMRVFDDNAL